MITIQDITEDNLYDVIGLKVKENQSKFVAPNVRSLAECYVYRDNNDVFPYAIVHNQTVIGFLLLELYEESNEIGIWRIMIGDIYQGKGYGFDAMKTIIEFIKENYDYPTLAIAYVKGNHEAHGLYTKLGFTETGVDDHDQITMSMPLK